ncbi:hypothetical protein [Lacticaseibacillus paracasei]|uniref:hypothetical protein n=1 Tax=Lacticaseibacillus paracasei TaxID=1597 RepID=UPI0021A7B87F|nr:hypothetical protein [Lacticaseibacillus paracasei]MCT3335164.1 hypothetical protein [Lacticaseibacillus paracasei]
MSNETKRDLFEELVEELADAYIALDGEGLGDELTNEEKQDYLKDYDNALPDETDNQKSCPYCHEVDPQSKHAHYGKAMSDKTEYFDFIRKHKLYRRVKARIKSPEDQHPKLCVTQMNRFREVSVVLDKAINYCPICGRKL